MENSQNKKSRVGELIIVILVLVCAFLVIADMATNLMEELDTQKSQVVLKDAETGTPNMAAWPTYPLDYTPVNELQ